MILAILAILSAGALATLALTRPPAGPKKGYPL